jgi:hypothetical protein
MAGFELTLYGRIWVTPEVNATKLIQPHLPACQPTPIFLTGFRTGGLLYEMLGTKSTMARKMADRLFIEFGLNLIIVSNRNYEGYRPLSLIEVRVNRAFS